MVTQPYNMSDTSSFYSTSSKPQIEEAPALADVEKAFDNAARRETPWATPRTHPRTCAQSDDAHSDTISFISVCFSPPERYLAQQRSDESFREKRKRLSAIVEAHEQRHPGKAGVKLSRFSRPFDPDLDTKEENEYLEQIRAAQGETWVSPRQIIRLRVLTPVIICRAGLCSFSLPAYAWPCF
jgi:hypothetical protein